MFAKPLRLTFLLLLFAANPVQAAITFDLAFRVPGDGTGVTENVVISPGVSLVGVELLLIERVTDGDTSILGNDSMVAGAGQVDNRSGNINVFAANVGVQGSNGLFSNLEVNTTGGGADAGKNDDDTVSYLAFGNGFVFGAQPGIQATEVGTGLREVVLGTLDITAPTSGSSVFSVTDFSSTESNFATFGEGSLEIAATNSGGSFNAGTLTITAIPEPSALFVLSLVGCCGLVTRRRRP